MTRSFLAAIAALMAVSVAHAADVARPLPVKAPAAVVAYDPYTGIYVGGELGYGFNRDGIGTTELVDLGTLSTAPQGVVGGGFVGLGTRLPGLFSSFGLDGYAGLEGNYDFANLHGTAAAPGTLVNITPTGVNPVGVVAANKLDWLASIRARFGLIYQNVMFYGTAGYGWGAGSLTGESVDAVSNSVVGAGSVSNTLSGFVWGGGVEFPWFFGQGWKARMQYLQYDFGSQNSLVSACSTCVSLPSILPSTVFGVSAKDRVGVVNAGISYKF